MTTLFAIDTAAERCTLALARPGSLATWAGDPGQTHLEHVMPMIEALFARQGLRPAQCDVFAFGSGPGSFTGLRVACTVVQGLAYGSGRPVVAVGNLPALAAGSHAAGGAPQGGGERVLAAIDARMGQAYVAVLEGAGLQWRTLLPPSLVDGAALPALARTWEPDVCAGDPAWLGAHLPAGSWPLRAGAADAGVIARLGLAQFARGEMLRPEQALPEYVRDEVARTVAQRRAAQTAGTA